jgi:hypothetical protein
MLQKIANLCFTHVSNSSYVVSNDARKERFDALESVDKKRLAVYADASELACSLHPSLNEEFGCFDEDEDEDSEI